MARVAAADEPPPPSAFRGALAATVLQAPSPPFVRTILPVSEINVNQISMKRNKMVDLCPDITNVYVIPNYRLNTIISSSVQICGVVLW